MPKTTPTAAELLERTERAKRDPRYLAAHGAALLTDYQALLEDATAQVRELMKAAGPARRSRKKTSGGARR